MKTETLDPLADARWAAFVDAAPNALVFHAPGWLRLLREQYRYEISAWCATGADGRVLAGLPVARVHSRLTGNRLVSVPFCDVCGPLAAADAPAEAMGALLEAVAAERARIGLDLEIHDEMPGSGVGRPSQRFLHHVVALSEDVEGVEAAFPKTGARRSGARRATRAGLRVERRTDEAALDAFYSLHLATRRRLGVPIQPRRFIRRFAELFEQGLGFVALVGGDDGAGPALAAVFLDYKGTLTYKYSASDRDRLRDRPNDLLFLETIRWACGEGFHTLDMGRTDFADEGLRDFKLSWGATERELSYTLLSDRPGDGNGGRGTPRVVRSVLRRSPPFVSRLAGEMLYRHFA